MLTCPGKDDAIVKNEASGKSRLQLAYLSVWKACWTETAKMHMIATSNWRLGSDESAVSCYSVCRTFATFLLLRRRGCSVRKYKLNI